MRARRVRVIRLGSGAFGATSRHFLFDVATALRYASTWYSNGALRIVTHGYNSRLRYAAALCVGYGAYAFAADV